MPAAMPFMVMRRASLSLKFSGLRLSLRKIST